MGSEIGVREALLGLVDDCIWGSPWHSLAEAVSDLTDDDLDFRPTQGVAPSSEPDLARPSPYGARAIYRHLIDSTFEAGNVLPVHDARTTGDQGTPEAFDWTGGADDLAASADKAFRQARDRAAGMRDDDLWRTSTAIDGLDGFSNAEVVVQCLVLHTSWHLGQLAVIPKWRALGEGRAPVPAAPKQVEALALRGAWPFHMDPSASARDLLCDVLHQAQSGCPWHALERTLDGLTDEEAEWLPHPAANGHCASIAATCGHVAACDVMYADMAFGERRADWGWVGSVLRPERALPPAEAVRHACRRGYEFLTTSVQQATDESLWSVHQMHHGRLLAGWQVVACMTQHRLWHAGQIAMLRSAYSGHA